MKRNNIIHGMVGIGLMTLTGCVSQNSGQVQPLSLAAPQTERPSSELDQLTNPSYGGAKVGNGSATCVGSYTAYAPITNSATGTIWFTPPSGTTNCVATDASGISTPYSSVVLAWRKRDFMTWCGTNSVTFPASSSEQYKFIIYIKNTPPPPTNGQVLTLDVEWQP